MKQAINVNADVRRGLAQFVNTQYALGQVRLLAAIPEVRECVVATVAHTVTARVGRRVVRVCNKSAVVDFARKYDKQGDLQVLDEECVVVKLSYPPPSRRKESTTSPVDSILALRETNDALDKMYGARVNSPSPDLDEEIVRLEARAAEIILRRAKSRLDPLRRKLAEAVEFANRSRGKREDSAE